MPVAGPHVLFFLCLAESSFVVMDETMVSGKNSMSSFLCSSLKGILQGNCARMLLPSLGHPIEIVLHEEYKEKASVLRDTILFPATQRSSKQRKGGNSCVLQPEHHE